MSHFLLSFLPYDALGFFALGLCWFLTGKVHAFLTARSIMDRPNERSMHQTPTPRGGGLAVMASLILGLLLFMAIAPYFFKLTVAAPAIVRATGYLELFWVSPTTQPALYLLAATALLISLSWMDDKKGMPASLRLGTHLLAAFIGTLALPTDTALFSNVLPLWLDRTLVILGWAWLMNLTNFMDGIDGITGIQIACTTIGAGLLFWVIKFIFQNNLEPNLEMALASLMAGSCLGFLIHNWHPARIFLGDVGSIPLGFLTGFLLLRLASAGYPIPALILPLYYLADSGITITKRALRKEKIWLPHREHFYQRATATDGRHNVIAIWILNTNLGLIALAGVALFFPWTALGAAIALVAVLLSKMHKRAQRI